LRVLNWASEYGLSFEQRGREWERHTPRSIIISDTGFDVIEPPRSAWIVCGTIWLAATAPYVLGNPVPLRSVVARGVGCDTLGCGA